MRIGARVWKTALAVALALAVSRLLGLQYPVFAGVAAVICMQPTVFGSIRSGSQRIQATVIGAAFSLLALIAMHHVPFLLAVRPLVVGLAVLVVMAVTIRLRWFDSLVLAAATVVVIMVLPAGENIYFYALDRTVVTFIGIVVATVVNAAFLAPRYRAPLWQRLRELLASTNRIYHQGVEAFCFRKLDLAREAAQTLLDSEELFRAVTTRMQWLEDEAKLRQAIHRGEEREIDVLRRAVRSVTEIRTSASTIVRLTEQILSREPKYVSEPARVYEILWDLAQIGFSTLDAVEAHLAGTASQEGDSIPTWTDDVHSRLIKGIRDVYEAPLDVFPLVEVSVMAFEVRRVTELANELADAIAGRGG
jgi:uncharacterized membrane protein YgaE (UPF0421/DUF939 family)